jgi:hypothetical protein
MTLMTREKISPVPDYNHMDVSYRLTLFKLGAISLSKETIREIKRKKKKPLALHQRRPSRFQVEGAVLYVLR